MSQFFGKSLLSSSSRLSSLPPSTWYTHMVGVSDVHASKKAKNYHEFMSIFGNKISSFWRLENGQKFAKLQNWLKSFKLKPTQKCIQLYPFEILRSWQYGLMSISWNVFPFVILARLNGWKTVHPKYMEYGCSTAVL